MKKRELSPMRFVWLFFGILSMTAGAVGVILPVLPTTPFLLLASFCFAKGSVRFHRWFTGTGLYRNHLESFVRDRGMTLKTKLRLLLPASVMLLLAFLAMPNIYGRCGIAGLLIFKYVYFFARIRTIAEDRAFSAESEGEAL